MVLFMVCYVITTNVEFREIRSKYNLLPEFDDTAIWHREETDDVYLVNIPELTLWREEENTEQVDLLPYARGFDPNGRVKVIFLARFWKRLNQYETASYREALQALFGEPPFDISLFDKWWSIERLEDAEVGFGWALDDLNADDLEPFVNLEDRHRDTWVEDIIIRKREKQKRKNDT